MTEYQNKILCPHCFEGGEEKACTHGCGPATCYQCGEKREPEDVFWHCVGSVAVLSPSPGEK